MQRCTNKTEKLNIYRKQFIVHLNIVYGYVYPMKNKNKFQFCKNYDTSSLRNCF